MFNQPLSFDTSKVTNMGNMFYVRSARALGPSLESGPPRARQLRRRHPAPSRLPGRIPLPALHARLSTRQFASVFNQPLSFDTSKVTNMGNMFYVCSARALGPMALSRALPIHAACVAPTQRPHASRAPLPTLHARLWTRQDASAFNQPLSFDTSSVTTMSYMFYVRSARALAPTALSRALPVHAACVAATHSALTPPEPHLFSHRMPAFRLGRKHRRSTSRSASTRPRSQQ